jgi:hypothetical protein
MLHRIRTEGYVHTETQDGKSSLDAHCGQGTRKLWRWVQQVNNCVTPSHLVVGLTADGGLPNCVAELVGGLRPHKLTSFLDQLASIECKFTKLVPRANHIIYNYPDGPQSASFSLDDCPGFTLRAFAFSNIDDDLLIQVSLSQRTCFPIIIDPQDLHTI